MTWSANGPPWAAYGPQDPSPGGIRRSSSSARHKTWTPRCRLPPSITCFATSPPFGKTVSPPMLQDYRSVDLVHVRDCGRVPARGFKVTTPIDWHQDRYQAGLAVQRRQRGPRQPRLRHRRLGHPGHRLALAAVRPEQPTGGQPDRTELQFALIRDRGTSCHPGQPFQTGQAPSPSPTPAEISAQLRQIADRFDPNSPQTCIKPDDSGQYRRGGRP